MMRRQERAFSVAEILVASAILTGLGVMAAGWMIGAWDAWATVTTQSDLRTRMQQALSRMATELRDTTRAGAGSPPNVAIPPAPGNTMLTFYLPADLDGNGLITDVSGNTEWNIALPVQFVYLPNTRQLQRIAGGAIQVIANDVAAVAFADRTIDPQLNLDEVRMTLTLQQTTAQRRTLSATAAASVKLRN